MLEAVLEKLRMRIGETRGPLVRTIEAGALIKFAAATGQTDPRYFDRTNGPVAAPTYISTFCAEAIAGLIDLDVGLPMFLHSDDIAELGAPILAGDEIRASARYVDAYLREGKRGPMLFQTAEMKLTNQADAHVATVRVSAVSL
ncbi:MAG: hypothetical protein C0520_00360 [Sphingopyxis sp.]|jgi:hypothetical protein|nr:hypothetical protein [Sphingopyxis sp.]OGT54987.1 MAG: hypothetical protein A3E01_11955 [Gammaproteobacteria bacterium RIFCSPHIGHO2_12_FULL_63_22]